MTRFCLLFVWLSLFASEYDCIVIGSSPFSLFEALYQRNLGKSVLILEAAEQCGGAWKAIDICGVAHVEFGCHQIGSNVELKAFLETYAGCHISPLPYTTAPSWYFTYGCLELIDHLLCLIQKNGIQLRVNCKAENIWIEKPFAIVQTEETTYRCRKLIVTPMSHCGWPPNPPMQKSKSYYHLYLLIEDPTPYRFTYLDRDLPAVTRMMNLTPFTDLAEKGKQLIAIQTRTEQTQNDSLLFDLLKERQLVDPSAILLQSEPYTYVSHSFPQHLIKKMEATEIVEILQTGHFEGLVSYIQKWKQVLIPMIRNNLENDENDIKSFP